MPVGRGARLRAGLALVTSSFLSLAGFTARLCEGQTVEFRRGTQGLASADRVIARTLSRGRYVVWSRDTVVVAGDVIAADVVVIRATLHVEGRMEGDLIAVQSDVFARPGARIDGAVVVLAGGFYGSSLAELGAPAIVAPNLDYRVDERGGGDYVITAPGGRAALRLPGIRGLLMPSYDRANALTLSWGIELDRGGTDWLPDARAQIRYRSARSTVDGEAVIEWPIGRQAVLVRAGRTVRSNDDWINGEVANSISSLVGGADYRNYYEARFAEGGLRLDHGARVRWSHGLTLGFERARTLRNRDPFSFFEYRGGFQPNLQVDEADVASLALRTSLQIRGRRDSSLGVDLSFERADRDVAGDLSFTLYGAAVRAQLNTVGEQSLVVRARGQVPGDSRAPAQRWRALGGWGTLPTLDRLEQAGERMWWVEATYRVPTRRRLDFVGRLVPWVRYTAGNAWSRGSARPPVVHNLGVGVSFGRLGAGLYTDPKADFETVVVVGLAAQR